ncbi:MAG: hypothetical protein HY580_03740, partial [Nitrospinae bacterium]|nr:hypothetical protein [Nitrospinota bacterium]
ELLWGLYDDQSREAPLGPLRYRGLPTYPSKEAFNIFSAFFIPSGPPGEKIFDVFMDLARSHEIAWLPRKDPPWRYFCRENRVCLTVQDHFLYKATVFDDPAAVPYVNCARGARPSCQRRIAVRPGAIALWDGDRTRAIQLNPVWEIEPGAEADKPQPQYPFGWQKFFDGNPPVTDPVKAVYTVPFYPEGESEIDEASLQPMALDQIFYYMETCTDMPEKLEKAERVLVHTFDAAISGCIDCTRERQYTVLYGDPEFAQKGAQLLWDYAAARNQLDALKRVSFLPEAEHVERAYQEKYGMIFKWIPFLYFQDRNVCEQILKSLSGALEPGGILFLAGPGPIVGLFEYYGLKALYHDPVIDMPFFQQHLKMCPENRLREDLEVFLAEKL